MSGKGDHESALKYFSSGVVSAPQFASAICEMGYCYEKLGRYPDTLSKFDKVLQIYPSHGKADMSRKRILKKMGGKK